MFFDDTSSFFQLLEGHFNLSEFIPSAFYNAITFLADDFKTVHPEMAIDKKSHSPDEDKSIGDVTCLKPVLSTFFSLHPNFHPNTFLGDSSFDTIETYGSLRDDFHFSKVLIPYNPRNESALKKVSYNEYGYPTCPNDSALSMKYCGVTREKGRTDRTKGTVQSFTWQSENISAAVTIPALPLQKAVPLIPTKIWISECSPASRGILMNGTPFTG